MTLKPGMNHESLPHQLNPDRGNAFVVPLVPALAADRALGRRVSCKSVTLFRILNKQKKTAGQRYEPIIVEAAMMQVSENTMDGDEAEAAAPSVSINCDAESMGPLDQIPPSNPA